MKLLFKLLMRIGLISSGPAVTGITSATQIEGTSLVHTVTLASAVAVVDGLYPFSLSGVTATSGTDYTATPTFSAGVTRSGGTLTVPVGVSSFTITVSTTNDTVYEGTETYNISVGGMTNTGTLTDNDSAPTIASVSSASATEGSNIVHTVAVTGVAQAARTFAISLSGGTATGGGTDYTSTLTNGAFSAGVTISGGNISVPSGVTSFTVTVPTTSDVLEEGNETYTLTIGGASGTGTIVDDDAPSPAFTVTMTALSNASGVVTTLAYINGGGGGGGSADITPDVQAARIAGVAPLYVNFDATGTTSTNTTNHSHEMLFTWAFGDTGAGNWTNGVITPGVQSKNVEFGPVAGHVFETPGTYTVTMSAYDGLGSNDKTVTITVQDPDVVFAGTDTICLSQTGDFTGAPAGSNNQTVSASTIKTAIDTYKGANKRILLHAGQTWSSSAQISMNFAGPFLLGKFGSGANPVITNTNSTTTTALFGFSTGSNDNRIVDIDIAGEAYSANSDVTQLTVARSSCLSMSIGLTFDPGETVPLRNYDQMCWYECYFKLNGTYTFGGTCGYVALKRGAYLGCHLDNNKFGEQTLRVPYIDRSVIAHNTLKKPLNGKNMLKIHGREFTSTSLFSEKFVVSSNIFDNRGGNYAINEFITAGNGNPRDERTRDFIIEGNIAYTDKTNPISGAGFFFSSGAQNCTVRNNLMDCSGTTDYRYCWVYLVNADSNTTHSGTASSGIRVYNNTMYGPITGSGTVPDWTGVESEIIYWNKSADNTDIVIKNNVIYADTTVRDGGKIIQNLYDPLPITASNNTVTKSTSPLLTAQPPVTYADWTPTGSSYAVNSGTPVPVHTDFFRIARSGTYDMGAVLP